MCSGRFDRTETFLSTSLKGKQGVQGVYALVRGGSSTSNLMEPTRTTSTEIARCVEVYHMSSGWFDCTEPSLSTSLQGTFDCTEPSLSTSLQGKQGVQGAHAIVRGGSSTANLLETTSAQR